MDDQRPPWAQRLLQLRRDQRWSQRELARRLRDEAVRRGERPVSVEHLARAARRWEHGEHQPNEDYRRLLAGVYGVPERALLDGSPAGVVGNDEADDFDPDMVELSRRAAASDVTGGVLDALDLAVVDLGRRYARTAPTDLLGAVRRRSRDVVHLLDGRATLGQRRRLLVAGGWLSLLAATVHVDLGHPLAARMARDTAASLGREAGEPELVAWAVENATWEAIVEQCWPEAVELARAGLGVAPRGGSAVVQLAAQEARAAARRGDAHTVHSALERAGRALDEQAPGPPDHHFFFDPAKLTGYTATSLAWLGDPAAEEYAREVVTTAAAPRRLATARIDLGLVLTDLGRPDEAVELGNAALDSRRLVSSNVWRAGELAHTLADRYPGLPEARDLDERFRAARPAIETVLDEA